MVEFKGRLTNAPIIYALCQVRFSPVLKIEDYIPSIQEEFRSKYPRLETIVANGMEITPTGLIPKNHKRWVFNDKASTSGFLLEASSAVFNTTKYTDFNEFLTAIIEGMSIIQRLLTPSLVERVGLRYIDHVFPKEGENIDAYFHDRLMGVPVDNFKFEPMLQHNVVVGNTEQGKLVIKFSKGIHVQPIPVDLLPINLATKILPDPIFSSVVLDTDHFSEKQFDFEILSLESLLRSLKEPISKVFKAVVTEHAVKCWK